MTVENDHEIPPTQCPACRCPLEAAMNAQDGVTAAPEAGDVVICLRCAVASCFRDGLKLVQRRMKGCA